MTLEQLANILSDIGKAYGWDISLVSDNGDDVIGVVLAHPDHLDRFMAPGYSFSVLTPPPKN